MYTEGQCPGYYVKNTQGEYIRVLIGIGYMIRGLGMADEAPFRRALLVTSINTEESGTMKGELSFCLVHIFLSNIEDHD